MVNILFNFISELIIVFYVFFISWLLQDKQMKLRTTYSGFTTAVNSYFDKLIPKIVPLQVKQFLCWIDFYLVVWLSLRLFLQFKRGGPVIALQVENEYGSYAKDEQYLLFIKEVQIFTNNQ